MVRQDFVLNFLKENGPSTSKEIVAALNQREIICSESDIQGVRYQCRRSEKQNLVKRNHNGRPVKWELI